MSGCPAATCSGSLLEYASQTSDGKSSTGSNGELPWSAHGSRESPLSWSGYATVFVARTLQRTHRRGGSAATIALKTENMETNIENYAAPSVDVPRLVRLWRRFVAWANQPTNNTGPGSKMPDETVVLLRSIDARLKTLEGCVRPGIRHKERTSHIVTGHWND